MPVVKTPGVYIIEKNAFPNSVLEVATAVPAFIGYTEKAVNGNKSLTNKPWKISSMAEFRTYFGDAPSPVFSIDNDGSLKREDAFTLYYHILLFYSNGGGPCYVVSVGDYKTKVEKGALEAGIQTLIKEQEPTMVVIPEAVKLGKEDCYALQRAMLAHCGNEQIRSRIAILDVYDGHLDRKDPQGDVVEQFRESIGCHFLDFGVAYYPWINTSIVQESELSFKNVIGGLELFRKKFYEEQGTNTLWERSDDPTKHKILYQVSPFYAKTMQEMRLMLNLLPPSAAMAGIYTMVDNTRGVWKAPANVGVSSTVSPAVSISHEEQEELNVPVSGKSVNAIRSFTGEGIKVWGARTLDGNSLDWRYINVRRTMIMLEQSIRNATKAYVFEPNEANTWVNIKCMISNFLNGIWKRGGLAGASPDDAYDVRVGLGETMTPEDVLEGILRVTVLVAITRPAEFIEITFQQQMQKS